MYDFDLFFFQVIYSTLIHSRKSVFESKLTNTVCIYRTQKCSMEHICQLLKKVNSKSVTDGYTERLKEKKWSLAGWHKNYWPKIHYTVSVILHSKQFCYIIITKAQAYKIQNHSAVTNFTFIYFIITKSYVYLSPSPQMNNFSSHNYFSKSVNHPLQILISIVIRTIKWKGWPTFQLSFLHHLIRIMKYSNTSIMEIVWTINYY